MALSENFMDELKKILKYEPGELSEAQIAFLRARQSYLSPEDREKYAEVLESEAPVDAGKPEIKMDEIRERAKAVDMKIPVGTKKEDALRMVEEAEAKKAEKVGDVKDAADAAKTGPEAPAQQPQE